MLQELFPCKQATHCHASSSDNPSLLTASYSHCRQASVSARGFYETVNNFICFQWQNIFAARVARVNDPHTHTHLPPPTLSRRATQCRTRWSTIWGGCRGAGAAPVGSALEFLLVEAACLELICCYRIVAASEGKGAGRRRNRSWTCHQN